MENIRYAYYLDIDILMFHYFLKNRFQIDSIHSKIITIYREQEVLPIEAIICMFYLNNSWEGDIQKFKKILNDINARKDLTTNCAQIFIN